MLFPLSGGPGPCARVATNSKYSRSCPPPPRAPIEFNAYPIRDAQSGQVTGVIVFVRDITSKRQIQQALTEIEDKYHTIYQGAPIGMCTLDAHDRFVSMNPSYARLHGYASPGALMNSVRSASELFESPEDWERLRALIGTQDEIFGFECPHPTPPTDQRSGLRAPSGWSATPGGQLLHYDVFVEDIEARKTARTAHGGLQMSYQFIFFWLLMNKSV